MDPSSASDTSSVEYLAIGISLFSLVVAGAAFGWQVLSWFLGGGRATATLKHGVRTPTGIMTRPVGASGVADYSGFDPDAPVLAEILEIKVTNRGRLPLLVESYGVDLLDGGGLSFTPIGDAAGSHPLPHELRPGHSASWWVDMTSVDALVYSGQVIKAGAHRAGMSVTLGTGKKIKTRRAIARPIPVD